MHYLKQSTTTTIQLGPFLDETTGKDAEVALTISSTDVWLSKAGAVFANPNDTNAATHDRAGWYRKQLNAADTGTVGRFIVSVHESGALPVWREFMVLPSNVYDSLVAGSDYLEVDIEAVSGDETAADNLELDYDGTGYARANSTIGTTTTNTDLVSAASIADAVWDEASAGHTDAGKAGEQLWTDIDAVLADTNELQTDDVPSLIGALPTAVQNRQEMDSNSTKLADIVADTNELQVDDVPSLIGALPTAVQNRQEMDSNSTKLADIVADTNELQTDDTPAAIAALPTAVENRTEMDSNSTKLADIVADTNELQVDDVPGLIGALNDVSTAEVNAQVDTALLDIHLDHLLAADYDPAAKPGAATALLNELVENDAGVSRFTANALEQAPSGGVSAADIADAVWEETVADHSGSSGSTAEALAGASAPSAADVADAVWEETVADHSGTSGSTAEALAAASAPSAAVVADAVWEEAVADHSGSSGSTAEALAGASAPSAADVADAVWDEDSSGHTSFGNAGYQLWTILNLIDSTVGGLPTATENRDAMDQTSVKLIAIAADTDELQTDDIPGLIAALNDPTAAAIADQVWEEALADHSGTSGSTAEALHQVPTASAVAGQVWEETLADHSGTSGSTAEALSQIPGATKGAVEYTYSIDDGSNPIDGAEVWITTDSGGNNVIWSGVSDALGVARASDDEKPWLDAGTYYGWAQKAGYSFSNPDTLAVS